MNPYLKSHSVETHGVYWHFTLKKFFILYEPELTPSQRFGLHRVYAGTESECKGFIEYCIKTFWEEPAE